MYPFQNNTGLSFSPVILQFCILFFNAHIVYHATSQIANPFVKFCTCAEFLMANCGSSTEVSRSFSETAVFHRSVIFFTPFSVGRLAFKPPIRHCTDARRAEGSPPYRRRAKGAHRRCAPWGYTTGVQAKDRTSPVFSFFWTLHSATLIRDWYLSFLGPDLE